MKILNSLIVLLIIGLNIQAQETKIPSIRPLLIFETGVVGNSMGNITSELEQYTLTKQSFDASLRMGVNAGVFIGERHKLALSYNSSLNTSHEAISKCDFYSIGFWYQFQVLKTRPFYVQLGFSETIANLYVSNENSNPSISNGILSEYLNNDANYILAHFEQWTDGLHLAVSYSFFETPLFALSGQLGYLWNFQHGNWQYMHNNLERTGNTKLPEDNLNGLFLKLNFEFDFVQQLELDKVD